MASRRPRVRDLGLPAYRLHWGKTAAVLAGVAACCGVWWFAYALALQVAALIGGAW